MATASFRCCLVLRSFQIKELVRISQDKSFTHRAKVQFRELYAIFGQECPLLSYKFAKTVFFTVHVIDFFCEIESKVLS